MTSCQEALEDAEKVVKKQRTCAERVDAALDQLISLVLATRAQLASGAPPGAVADLRKQIQKLGLEKEMNSQTKELHTAVGKLNKSLDKAFDGSVDICRALRSVRFDTQTLNQVIAEHFYREGRFELGDIFVAEAGVAGAEAIKAPYVSLHRVLQQLRARNLGPVLEWAQQHRAQLSPDGGPCAFEFGLHALAFIELLTGGGGVVAAGTVALPALTKMAGVMEKSGQDYDACEQLPTDVPVGPEFIFHSTFACPVSKDQSTPENPPKLLPCGHVLCEQSIAKIADRSRTRVFKCPYCPLEARADNTRELIFPDVL